MMRLTALAAAGLALVGIALASDADAAIRKTTSIPAQGLAPALELLARDRGFQILYIASVVDGVNTGGAVGDLTVDEALTQILSGTGLVFEYVDQQTVTVRTLPTASQENAKNQSSMTDSLTMESLVESRALEQAEERPPGPIQMQQTSSTQLGVKKDTPPLEEILVTGTRIRGAKSAAPTISISRDDIQNSGYATVSQLFNSLPQNVSSLTAEQQYGSNSVSLVSNQNYGRATAVDLRGLGPESTLTLINGNRRAGSINGRVVDVSTIPLSAIDRVEVVTGGRSAVYGSDAVAGVVNIITRRSFDGAEVQAEYSGTDTGGERLELGVGSGVERERGGMLFSYNYNQDQSFDLVETGLVISPTPSGAIPLRREIQPDAEQHSALVTGSYSVSSNLELFADAGYSTRNSEVFATIDRIPGAPEDSTNFTQFDAEHWDVLAGARFELGGKWELEAAIGASEVEEQRVLDILISNPIFTVGPLRFEETNATQMTTGSIVLNGPTYSFGSVTPEVAIGIQSRKEEFEGTDPGLALPVEKDRTINAAFIEVLVPFIKDGGPGARELSVSLAARYDDYNDIGDTTNPQVGVVWSPHSAITFRGAYSTSFRAPSFVDFGSVNVADIYTLEESPGGPSFPVLFEYLAQPDLQPEEAETRTLSIDFRPTSIQWFSSSLTYYDIDYSGRIAPPASFADLLLVLQRESFFPGLVNRSPTAAQVNDILSNAFGGVFDTNTGDVYDGSTDLLAIYPDLIVFDNRTTNIADESVRGLDLLVRLDNEVSFGTVSGGLNVAYTIDHERSITSASPSFSLLDEVGRPVDLRVRADVGLDRGQWSAFAHLNYVDGYSNPLSITRPNVSSWTTVDLSLMFEGDNNGPLSGFKAGLSVSNLFDEPPPFVDGNGFGVAYDGTNASGIGRLYSLRLSKRW